MAGASDAARMVLICVADSEGQTLTRRGMARHGVGGCSLRAARAGAGRTRWNELASDGGEV